MLSVPCLQFIKTNAKEQTKIVPLGTNILYQAKYLFLSLIIFPLEEVERRKG